MHRQKLLKLLYNYKGIDSDEELSRTEVIGFVETHTDCFERTCKQGHITGSAWLENHDGTKFLLTLHKKASLWLQLGGHADGDQNVLNVAIKEAKEESGLNSIICLQKEIFDIDVHRVSFAQENAHLHYDIRFMLKAVNPFEEIKISDESIDLKWFSALPEGTDVYLSRMFKKWYSMRR